MKNELQDKSKISIYILFIWIACLVFGGVGALLVSLAVSASTANDTTLFAGVFELIFFDLAIFIVAIIIATKASKKVGLTVAGDKSFTKQLLRTMFFSIGGILLGLRAWLSVALSSRPPIFLPIGACLLALIL